MKTVRVGFAPFQDGTFELSLEDVETAESVTLTGKITPKEAEFVDKIFPTCVYVKATVE